MEFLELLLSLLAAFGLMCLLWLGVGWMLLPLRCPARVELEAQGGGEELERGVRGLLWLRRAGLWRGTVVLRDGGLDERGLALARTLARQEGVELTAPKKPADGERKNLHKK